MQHLPKRYKGRCQPTKFKKNPLVAPAKKARDGDYNPPFECASFQSKKFVKQIRRLSSLRMRLKALEKVDCIWNQTYVDLWREWTSILNWNFKRQNFLSWALDKPELFPFPKGLPTIPWLLLAEQFLQHQLHDMLHFEQSLRNKMSKMRHIIDCQSNFHREAYRTIKKQEFLPFHHVHKNISEDAILVPMPASGHFKCFVENPDAYQQRVPLNVDGTEAALIQCHDHSLEIRMPPGYYGGSEYVPITQQQCSFHIHEVFDELSSYWQQFWYQGRLADETDFQEEFQSEPVQFPQLDDSFEDNLDEWKLAIAQCKGDASPGIDGFTFRELKQLPDVLLKHLVRIISGMKYFPEHLMIAKTIPLPKKGKLTADNSRPITILATLYRLWGRVCTKRCLQHLAKHVSPAITGMIPKRGAHEASYSMQAMLERHCTDCHHITGLTLDLRKCFNLLHRANVRQLMLNHGLPVSLVMKWFDSIQKLTRYWDVSKTCSSCLPTNHGCPEGDAWSVVAMICTAQAWSQLLVRNEPAPLTTAFADNWTFWMNETECSSTPVELTKDFTAWMGLEINWGKTWLWSTSSTGVAKLKSAIQDIVPTEVLQTQVHATDLGCQMTYHGTAKMGIMHDRLALAKQRLETLKHCTWALPLKIHVVITCILPLALYGAELLAIGQKHLSSLRSQIADALVGENVPSMSSSIFLHCATFHDLDPHMVVLLKAIKAARKYLTFATQDTQAKFF